MTSFKSLLSPIGFDNFINSYFEKQFLYNPLGPSAFNDVLTVTELSDYLEGQSAFYPAIRLVKNGSELSKDRYTYKKLSYGHQRVDFIIDFDKLMALFNEGATIVVQSGHRIFKNLADCCLDLSNTLGYPIQANIYITPPQKKGFNPHWDTHDVFALQLHGEKNWNLYDVEKTLPLKTEAYKNSIPIQSKITKQLHLKKGDLLYVPRGLVHDAYTENSHSIHITIGVLGYTWDKALENILDTFKAKTTSVRKSIPLWDGALMETQLKGLKKELIAHVEGWTSEMYAEGLAAKTKNYQPQLSKRYFASLLALDAIHMESQFNRNKSLILEVDCSDTTYTIHLAKKTISLPIQTGEAVNYIVNQDTFVAKELLSFLNEKSSIVLLKSLTKEGLIYLTV